MNCVGCPVGNCTWVCPQPSNNLYAVIFLVVIAPSGKVMGKSRKNHIPRVGDFNEVSQSEDHIRFYILPIVQ